MLQRPNSIRDLDSVEMLIRALADEMTQLRRRQVDDESPDAVLTQVEEALYELRLRKMLLSALN